MHPRPRQTAPTLDLLVKQAISPACRLHLEQVIASVKNTEERDLLCPLRIVETVYSLDTKEANRPILKGRR